MSSELEAVKLVNHRKNRGYGAALLSGFRNASCSYLFFMDSDGQFQFRDIANLLPFLGNYDMVIGYRKKRADSVMRHINAWLYKQFIFVMLGIKVRDLGCAFKIFPRRVLDALWPLKSHGAFINAEFLTKAKRKGFSMKEVPVHHYHRK